MKTERMAVLDVFDAWKAANLSGDPMELRSALARWAMLSESSEAATVSACPSCQATDNNAYVDANGVAMRACGRCMIQWRTAQPLTPNAGEVWLPSDVADFLVSAASFLRSRDNMNATLHLADVRLSPLTQKAVELVDRYKIGPQPALAASTPAGPTADEVAWLIERGGLCLGFCEHRFAWLSFTDENALRFARSRDAYGFMETVKWTPYNLHLEGATVTEHMWTAGAAKEAGGGSEARLRTIEIPKDCAIARQTLRDLEGLGYSVIYVAPDKPQPSETRTCEHEE